MRCTLDWDNCSEETFNERMNTIRNIYPMNRIKYRQSSSKTGYHVVIFGGAIDWPTCKLMRRALWDDQDRLRIDNDRQKEGVIFNQLAGTKFNKKAGEWTECSV